MKNSSLEKELIKFHDWCVKNVDFRHKDETTKQRVIRYFESQSVHKLNNS